jgi:hypothetical protein
MIFSTDTYQPLSRSFSEQASDLDILEAAPDAALQLARRNYLGYTEKFLGQPVGNRLLLDKNPAINPLIPAIVRVFPEAKFIVGIRDPRDVCLSCFMLRFNEHARNKIIRSPTYADVSKPVFKTAIGRWRNYQKYLEPSLAKLDPFVKTFGYEPS